MAAEDVDGVARRARIIGAVGPDHAIYLQASRPEDVRGYWLWFRRLQLGIEVT